MSITTIAPSAGPRRETPRASGWKSRIRRLKRDRANQAVPARLGFRPVGVGDGGEVVDHPVVHADGEAMFAGREHARVHGGVPPPGCRTKTPAAIQPHVGLPHRAFQSQRHRQSAPRFGNFNLALIPRRADEEMPSHEIAVFVRTLRLFHAGKTRRHRKRRGVEHRVRVQRKAEPGAIRRVRQRDPVVASERSGGPIGVQRRSSASSRKRHSPARLETSLAAAWEQTPAISRLPTRVRKVVSMVSFTGTFQRSDCVHGLAKDHEEKDHQANDDRPGNFHRRRRS